MRSDLALIKSLLYFLLTREDRFGLCKANFTMCENGFLTIHERVRLEIILNNNKPLGITVNTFYWFVSKEARIIFLHRLIDKFQGFESINPSLKIDKRFKLIEYVKEELPF